MTGSPDASQSALKILITNVILTGYTGTEVVVRDLAMELKRLGHLPFLLTRKTGLMSREIDRLGIEVLSDLRDLTVEPDVIHGHHHAPFLEALLHFPSVPAVWVCHDATSRWDEPFQFPRILRYVAVDDRCRKRIERNPEIATSRIEVRLNAVDLERFRPRDPLPAKAKRALVFSNQAAQLPAIRRACRAMGLQLDVVGLGAGPAVPNPELVLPKYDIVFAKARCALEALAVGNAVVLCDATGAGPMVTAENLGSLQRMNFGAGVLTHPLRAEHLEREIQRYDSADAAGVSQRIRNEAGLAAATRGWTELYRAVIAEHHGMDRDPDSESRALAGYLRQWHYESRVDWEVEQLNKVRSIPVMGNGLFRSAKRFLSWWRDR
jgi:hypothetical protein